MRAVGGVIGLLVLGSVAWFILSRTEKEAAQSHRHSWTLARKLDPADTSSRARTALKELGYRVISYTAVKDGASVTNSASAGVALPPGARYSHVVAEHADGTVLDLRIADDHLTVLVTVQSSANDAEQRVHAFVDKLGLR